MRRLVVVAVLIAGCTGPDDAAPTPVAAGPTWRVVPELAADSAGPAVATLVVLALLVRRRPGLG